MANYKKMYSKLFNDITDAIQLLQSAQYETEEMYIKQQDPDVVVIEKSDSNEES